MAAPYLTFSQIGQRVARRCRRSWTHTDHAAGIRQSINDAMDEMSRYAAWPFRMADATLALGSPDSSGTRYYDLPSDFGYIDPKAMRSTGHNRPLIYESYDFVVDIDPTWTSQGSPDYWGIHGRQFFFYPRISTSWAAGASNAIYYAYSKMLKHVAEDGSATSTEYGDTDSPDCPADYAEGLLNGALVRELEVRLGPGAGDRANVMWQTFLTRMAGKTDVIGGGGSPFVRLSRRNLIGSSLR